VTCDISIQVGPTISDTTSAKRALGAAAVKIASHGIAVLHAEVEGAHGCSTTDGPSTYGAVEHMLRTVRFRVRLAPRSH
jgi:hypothetical protein